MTTLKRTEEFKGTRGCAVKHFTFCYDNRCQVYKEAKYGASYWPQEPSPDKFKDTEEEDVQDRHFYGKDIYRNNEPEDPKRTANPYLNTSYNSFYNYNPEEETFSNTENTQIKYFAEKARRAVKSNIRIKSVPKIKITKLKILETNLFIDQSDYKVIEELKYTLKTETETALKPESVMGIETPLDTMSIIL